MRTLPVEIILPDTTPARTEVNIEIFMTSEGDSTISDSVILTLEARQDHRWDIVLYSPLGPVEGNTFAVNPGDSFIVGINATNTGNLDDDISVSGIGVLSHQGSDTETGWGIFGDNVSAIQVNDSTILELVVEVPLGAWNGTTYHVNGSIVAFDVEVYTFTFTIEVAHVAGWNAIASDADLEIDPSGSTVSLTVVQEGNSPTRPYVSVQVDGEIGWVVETPDELPILDPGGTATLDLQITPPSTARHGRTAVSYTHLRAHET